MVHVGGVQCDAAAITHSAMKELLEIMQRQLTINPVGRQPNQEHSQVQQHVESRFKPILTAPVGRGRMWPAVSYPRRKMSREVGSPTISLPLVLFLPDGVPILLYPVVKCSPSLGNRVFSKLYLTQDGHQSHMGQWCCGKVPPAVEKVDCTCLHSPSL